MLDPEEDDGPRIFLQRAFERIDPRFHFPERRVQDGIVGGGNVMALPSDGLEHRERVNGRDRVARTGAGSRSYSHAVPSTTGAPNEIRGCTTMAVARPAGYQRSATGSRLNSS